MMVPEQKRQAVAGADGGARQLATPLREGSSSRANVGAPTPPAPQRPQKRACRDPRAAVLEAVPEVPGSTQ